MSPAAYRFESGRFVPAGDVGPVMRVAPPVRLDLSSPRMRTLPPCERRKIARRNGRRNARPVPSKVPVVVPLPPVMYYNGHTIQCPDGSRVLVYLPAGVVWGSEHEGPMLAALRGR